MNPYKDGSQQAMAWTRGAHDGAREVRRGMTDDGKHFFHTVKALAQSGKSQDTMVEWTAFVLTCKWPLRRRAKLAWRILTRRL